MGLGTRRLGDIVALVLRQCRPILATASPEWWLVSRAAKTRHLPFNWTLEHFVHVSGAEISIQPKDAVVQPSRLKPCRKREEG